MHIGIILIFQHHRLQIRNIADKLEKQGDALTFYVPSGTGQEMQEALGKDVKEALPALPHAFAEMTIEEKADYLKQNKQEICSLINNSKEEAFIVLSNYFVLEYGLKDGLEGAEKPTLLFFDGYGFEELFSIHKKEKIFVKNRNLKAMMATLSFYNPPSVQQERIVLPVLKDRPAKKEKTDEITIGLFGHVRKYKQPYIYSFIQMFHAFQFPDNVKLRVVLDAIEGENKFFLRHLILGLGDGPNIYIAERRLSPDELDKEISSCDILAVPYSNDLQISNFGASSMALAAVEHKKPLILLDQNGCEIVSIYRNGCIIGTSKAFRDNKKEIEGLIKLVQEKPECMARRCQEAWDGFNQPFPVKELLMKNPERLEIPCLEIKITDSCNLKCRCCSSFSNLEFHKPYMAKAEDIRKDLAELRQIADIPLAVISGGEPTQNPELKEILKACREVLPGSEIVLETNGVRLATAGKEWADFLFQQKIEMKVSYYTMTEQLRPIIRAKYQKDFLNAFRYLNRASYSFLKTICKDRKATPPEKKHCPWQKVIILRNHKLYDCYMELVPEILKGAVIPEVIRKKLPCGDYSKDIADIRTMLDGEEQPNTPCAFCSDYPEHIPWQFQRGMNIDDFLGKEGQDRSHMEQFQATEKFLTDRQ